MMTDKDFKIGDTVNFKKKKYIIIRKSENENNETVIEMVIFRNNKNWMNYQYIFTISGDEIKELELA